MFNHFFEAPNAAFGAALLCNHAFILREGQLKRKKFFVVCEQQAFFVYQKEPLSDLFNRLVFFARERTAYLVGNAATRRPRAVNANFVLLCGKFCFAYAAFDRCQGNCSRSLYVVVKRRMKSSVFV